MSGRSILVAMAGAVLGMGAAIVVPRFFEAPGPDVRLAFSALHDIGGNEGGALSVAEQRRQEAWTAATSLVREQLERPMSARFPELPPASLGDGKPADLDARGRRRVFELTSRATADHQEWSIEGWVDSESLAGKLVKRRFSVDVAADGAPKRWRLLSFSIDPR